MAGHQHGDGILAVGGPDRPRGIGIAHGAGDVGIAAGFPERDLAQLAPHCLLEGRAVDVDRQFRGGLRGVDRLQRAFYPRRDRAVVGADIRVREAAAQRAFVLVEGQAANALRCRSHQQRTKRAFGNDIADGFAAAAVAPGRGGHSQPVAGVLVEAARRRIAGVVDGFGHALILFEMLFGAPRPDGPGVGRRRDAHVAREDPLEMMLGIADGGSQLTQAERLLRLFDQPDRPGHRLTVAADFVRFAAHAGTVTGGAGGFGVEEEFDILPLGPARGAARLAVDSSRLDRADHSAVPAPVAAFESSPGGFDVNCSHQHGPNIGARPRSRFPCLAVKRNVDELAIL